MFGTALVGLLGIPAAVVFGEPYPWLMMPRFGSAGGFDGERITTELPVFEFHFRDGEVAIVDGPTLFSAVSSSNYHRLATRFSPEGRSLRRLSDRIPTSLLPGYRRASHTGPPDPDDPQLVAWFEERARTLFPDRDLVMVEVSWRRRTFDRHGMRADVERFPPQRFVP